MIDHYVIQALLRTSYNIGPGVARHAYVHNRYIRTVRGATFPAKYAAGVTNTIALVLDVQYILYTIGYISSLVATIGNGIPTENISLTQSTSTK